METQTSTQTIRDQIFAQAEEQLRGLVLERERHKEEGEIATQFDEAIKLAESVLAWRARFGIRSDSSQASEFEEPEKTQVMKPHNPLERYLETVRLDLRRHYEQRVGADVRDWLEHWPLKVDAVVLEKSLEWLSTAATSVSTRQEEWAAIVRSRQGRRLGIFGKLRAFRTSKECREREAHGRELDAGVVAEQARLQKHIEKVKVAAGMLSVFLKVQAGGTAVEHRILKKVLELDRERDLRRHLQQRIEQTRRNIAELEEQRRQVKRDRDEALEQRARVENRKQMRLLEIYSRSEVDPCELVMQATEVQINSTYAEVEKLIRQELHEVSLREKRCQKLDSEFQRLIGVVHEYQKTAQGAEERTQNNSAEPGEAPRAEEEPRRDLCH
jgi:hypothetical protein